MSASAARDARGTGHFRAATRAARSADSTARRSRSRIAFAGDMMMPEPSAGRRLRDAWTKEPIMIPGVFNALVGRMADRIGFSAIYLSGAALSAAAAVPDVGLLSLTEFVDQARSITAATPLPLLCDA